MISTIRYQLTVIVGNLELMRPGVAQADGFIKQSRGHVKTHGEPGEGTAVKMIYFAAAVVNSR